jgi:hypothetical protein
MSDGVPNPFSTSEPITSLNNRLYTTWGTPRSKTEALLRPVTVGGETSLVYWTPPPSEQPAAATPSAAGQTSSPVAATGAASSGDTEEQWERDELQQILAEAKAENAANKAKAAAAAQAAQRATAAQAASYNTLTSGSYSDPPVVRGTRNTVSNVYTLTFFEDYLVPDSGGTAVDLPYVNKFTMSAPNAVMRTRGMDGEVYAEHAGFIQRTIVIEGRSGALVGRMPNGIDPMVPDLKNLLDINRFTQLRNFLETYSKTSSINKNALIRAKNTQLILDCSFEDERFLCDVVDFQYRRNTQSSTLSFEYTITLVTNGFFARQATDSLALGGNAAKAFKEPDLRLLARLRAEALLFELNLKDSLSFSDSLRMLEKLRASARRESAEVFENRMASLACDDIYTLRVAISIAQNELMRLMLLGTEDNRRVVTTIQAMLAQMSSLIDIAYVLKGRNRTACPVPVWSEWYYSLFNPITSALLLNSIHTLSPGFVPQVQPSDAPVLPFRPGLGDKIYTPPTTGQYVDVALTESTTNAYDIAAWWFGNPDLYWRVILANNMRDAYTREDGTHLTAGSIVRLPDQNKPPTKNNDILGTDILIVNGDLQLSGNADVMRVSGYACYSQNLTHRMLTERGSNKVFPRYGLRAGIVGSASSSILAELRSDVRDQLRQDHRTDRVEQLQLDEIGDKVNVSVLVTPITGNAGQFNFNYTFREGARA